MTQDDVVRLLKDAVDAEGSKAGWAERHSVHPSVLSDVLRKRRDPTPPILAALNLERVVSYRVLIPGADRP